MLLAALAWLQPALAVEREPLVLITATGAHAFSVEIADTDETRARGLMFRRSIGDREGMLFLYDRPLNVTMWMRNTYISLDMIFMTRDGIVQRVVRNTEPFSERVIAAGMPVSAVLEVKAGTADRIGLKPGDRVESRRFRP